MSADPTNGQSNIDVILKAIAPERREAFLKSRNRLKQFNENDEILALHIIWTQWWLWLTA